MYKMPKRQENKKGSMQSVSRKNSMQNKRLTFIIILILLLIMFAVVTPKTAGSNTANVNAPAVSSEKTDQKESGNSDADDDDPARDINL